MLGMMMLVWAHPAHADAWDDLSAATAAGMDVAVACTDGRRGWKALSALAGDEPTGTSSLADTFFEADTRLVVGFSMAGGSLLRFTTDRSAESVATGFAGLMPGRAATVEADGAWRVTEAEAAPWRIAVADGWAEIGVEDGPRRAVGAPPAEIRGALTDTGGGCTAYADLAPSGAPPIRIGARLPDAAGTPVSFALLSPPLAGVDGMRFATTTPLVLHARHRPDTLLHVGLGADDIDFSHYAKGEMLTSLTRAQRHLPIARGSVIASVLTERGPATVVVLPLTRPLAPAVAARRATDVLASAGARVAHVDRTHFVTTFGEIALHGVGRRGRIYLSTDLPLLYEIAADQGDAWLTPTLEDASRRFPLVLELAAPPNPTATEAAAVQVAFDVRRGLATGEIRSALGPADLQFLMTVLPNLLRGGARPGGAQPAIPEERQRM